MFVIKRDGRNQKFNNEKVVNAIQSAFKQIDGEITKQAIDKSKEIAKYIESLNNAYDAYKYLSKEVEGNNDVIRIKQEQ